MSSDSCYLKNGFTLVELMVVIAILAILSSFIISTVVIVRKKAKVRETEIYLQIIEMAATNYNQDHRDFPGGSKLTGTPSETSAILFDGLTNGTGRMAPYLKEDNVPIVIVDGKKVFVDSWRNPIAYKHPSAYMHRPPKADSIRLYSAGPDGNFEKEDDNIVNWNHDDFPDASVKP
jgi:prepilin-type N-terminal cleavage/methylation domain-containing protein